MPVRARAHVRALFASLALVVVAGAGFVPALRPAPVAAAGEKVAIIVGPVGSLTSTYRGYANEVAAAATAAGATVVKAYSPKATWRNVRAAVNGANVVVYFGHGNGFPNPYGSTELTDRTNGWGLNRTTGNGDSDDWSRTLAYCGEKALLGTLTASDGAVQRQYCNGGPITPAAGFTMVYAQAHYAPGFGERYKESDPLTTRAEARARVKNYSTPVLRLGGTFIATAYGDADEIVNRLLTRQTSSYAEIFRAGRGYSASTLNVTEHPDVPGNQVWIQRTKISMFHFGDPDYWYAFAGNPAMTPSMTMVPYPDATGSKFYAQILWVTERGLMSGCSATDFCPKASLTRGQLATALATGLNLPATTADFYPDDEASPHEADINRLAAAGLARGCGDGNYCPTSTVYAGPLATTIATTLNLPPTDVDYFSDDEGNRHEANINRLAAAGITTGCGGGRYCPETRVSRASAAAFLRNTFD